MALSDLADLAAVLVGLLAIGATIRVAQVTARLQGAQLEQSRYDELTEVLLQINQVLPRIGIPAVYAEQAQALRFLASRADQLIREVNADRITPFDLLSIGNAFHNVSGMEKASEYLDRAQQSASEPFDRIPALFVLATVAFSTGDPERGRRAFTQLIETAQRWRSAQGDTALDTALLQTLNWAAQEHAVPDPARRDALLAQAETYLPQFSGEWRRVRGRAQIEQHRAGFAPGADAAAPAGSAAAPGVGAESTALT